MPRGGSGRRRSTAVAAGEERDDVGLDIVAFMILVSAAGRQSRCCRGRRSARSCDVAQSGNTKLCGCWSFYLFIFVRHAKVLLRRVKRFFQSCYIAASHIKKSERLALIRHSV